MRQIEMELQADNKRIAAQNIALTAEVERLKVELTTAHRIALEGNPVFSQIRLDNAALKAKLNEAKDALTDIIAETDRESENRVSVGWIYDRAQKALATMQSEDDFLSARDKFVKRFPEQSEAKS